MNSTKYVDGVQDFMNSVISNEFNIIVLPMEPKSWVISNPGFSTNSFLDPRIPEINLLRVKEIIDLYKKCTGHYHPLVKYVHNVQDRGCPLYHVDYINMRFIFVFDGMGTEIISNENVNRNSLTLTRSYDEDFESYIIRRNSQVLLGQSMFVQPNSLVCMKGELDMPGNGAVHRTPQKKENRTFLMVTGSYA